MDTVQDKAFFVASIIAHRKEKAIEGAINAYFGGKTVDEETLKSLLSCDIQANGQEKYFINGNLMVKVSPMTTDVKVNGQRVHCLYCQDIEVFY